MNTHTTSAPTTLATLRRGTPAARPSVTLPRRPRRTHVLTRVLAPWLDARLADGAAPESGRLLAARASELVDVDVRRTLADAWDHVLVRAAQASGPVDARAPLARDDVRAARGEIAELAAALRTPSPVAARDVARAQVLLTDGTGALYTPGSDLRLRVALLVADLTTLP